MKNTNLMALVEKALELNKRANEITENNRALYDEYDSLYNSLAIDNSTDEFTDEDMKILSLDDDEMDAYVARMLSSSVG